MVHLDGHLVPIEPWTDLLSIEPLNVVLLGQVLLVFKVNTAVGDVGLFAKVVRRFLGGSLHLFSLPMTLLLRLSLTNLLLLSFPVLLLGSPGLHDPLALLLQPSLSRRFRSFPPTPRPRAWSCSTVSPMSGLRGCSAFS